MHNRPAFHIVQSCIFNHVTLGGYVIIMTWRTQNLNWNLATACSASNEA